MATHSQALREARAMLGAEVDQQRRNLRELEERLAEMDREIDSVEDQSEHGAITTTGVGDSVPIRSRIAFRDALLMQLSGRRR